MASSLALCSPPANLQCTLKFNFLFSFLSFLLFSFFLKTSRAPKGGFHPNFLPWVPPREFFTKGYYSLFLFFFLLTSLGRLRRGFQPNDGTQAPHGGFHLSPYFFFSFSEWVKWRLRHAPLPSLSYSNLQ